MPTNTGEYDESSGSGRWLSGGDVLDTELPESFQSGMSRFLASDLETLRDWVAEIRTVAGGDIDAEKLCHADAETPHRAELDGETYHFQCFYDAVALAHIEDAPADIHTESPGGDVIEARATGDDIEASPPGAVVSFGVAAAAEPASEDGPTIREAYGAICPYVKAFPSREAYEAWADGVDAETVGLPLEDGVPVAAALVG